MKLLPLFDEYLLTKESMLYYSCSKCSEIVVGIPKLFTHLTNCRKIEIGQEVSMT